MESLLSLQRWMLDTGSQSQGGEHGMWWPGEREEKERWRQRGKGSRGDVWHYGDNCLCHWEQWSFNLECGYFYYNKKKAILFYHRHEHKIKNRYGEDGKIAAHFWITMCRVFGFVYVCFTCYLTRDISFWLFREGSICRHTNTKKHCYQHRNRSDWARVKMSTTAKGTMETRINRTIQQANNDMLAFSTSVK